MPIVDQPDPQSSLTQGDILKGVPLYASADWENPKHERIDCVGCLIISRPCVVGHKVNVTVAAIKKRSVEKPDGCDEFDDVLSFLEAQRDGFLTRDRFYLGQHAALGEGTFLTHLDEIATLKMPETNSRPAMLSKFRVGRLSNDFVRDLHLRFFSAFVSLGFNDHAWFSDKDLKWLVSAGQSQLQILEREHSQGESIGFVNPKHKTNIERQLTELRAKIEPYAKELAERFRD